MVRDARFRSAAPREELHKGSLYARLNGDGEPLGVVAVQAIRRMRGGAQSQLMLGSDGGLWVVKFQNNPQHRAVLVNELLATRIAGAAGLSVPACDVVDVSAWLIEHSADMWVDCGRGERVRCSAGLQFGSRFAGGLMPGQVVDALPEELLRTVRNLGEFAGMLVVDKWTGNCNGRQAVYVRKPRERLYRAVFIDQGFCFNAGEWTFPDAPLRGVFPRNIPYEDVTGWEGLEPWLSRCESMSPEVIWEIAGAVPPEWYDGKTERLEQLIEVLLRRRGRIRELIVQFRDSDRNPFPKWAARDRVAMSKMH